jgi:chloramphenicol O-acetyltransferase type B
VVILPGITVGEGAVVGANSLVTKDVEPWTIVAGQPAKLIRRIENKYDE